MARVGESRYAREVELHNTVEPERLGFPHGVPQQSGPRQRREAESDDDDRGPILIKQYSFDDSERTWCAIIFLSSCFDLFGSLVIMCTAFKYAYRDGGVSLYSLGFQSLSHWISSILLALRFGSETMTSRSTEQLILRERRLVQLYREQGLSMSMAIVMLCSSAGLLFKAFRKLKFWELWEQDLHRRAEMDREIMVITQWLAWTGFALYCIQAILRIIGALKLKVGMMSHGMVASIVSLSYLLVLGLAASYEEEWSWKAEPIAAIVLVFVTLGEGVRIVYNYIDDMPTRLRMYDRA